MSNWTLLGTSSGTNATFCNGGLRYWKVRAFFASGADKIYSSWSNILSGSSGGGGGGEIMGIRKSVAYPDAVVRPQQSGTDEVEITYTYDPLNRLTAADYDTGVYFHYGYDAVGNRVSETTQNGTVISTYDDANRLSSVGGVSYTWDANGNLLSDGMNSYSYDHANRLKAVSDQMATVSYQYNGLGDRVSQTANSVTTNYTLDLNAGLTQVLQDGTYTYLYGADRIAQYGAASTEYFLGDALGSVRQMVDASGVVVLAKIYDPYGNVSASSGAGSSSYGYTGEQTDSWGGVYLRARYYSPSTGRFSSRDTWAGDAYAPMSYNVWSYGYANPINRTDPSGRTPTTPPSGSDNHRDLTFWLYTELYANANSTYAKQINSLMGSYNPFKMKRGLEAFNLLVKDKAKWDFKHKIKQELDYEAFVLFGTEGYRWYEYSVPGNINFGFVGRASGIPGWLLHAGAGYAEADDPAHDERGESNCCPSICLKLYPKYSPIGIPTICKQLGCYYINPQWIRSGLDDPVDWAAVEFGIKLFDNFKYGLTLSQFQEALSSNGSSLAPPPIRPGWNWVNNRGKWPYRVGYFNGPREAEFEPEIQRLLR